MPHKKHVEMMFKDGIYHFFFTDGTIVNHNGEYLGNWELIDGILYDISHYSRTAKAHMFSNEVQAKYRQWLTDETLRETK